MINGIFHPIALLLIFALVYFAFQTLAVKISYIL